MKSDKELLREGKYEEALGANFSSEPYYILDFRNGFSKDPITIDKHFRTKELLEQYVFKYNIDKYMVGDLNAEWL